MTQEFFRNTAQGCCYLLENMNVTDSVIDAFITEETARNPPKPANFAEQVDAIVDMAYYIGDTTCEFGYNFNQYSGKIREFTAAAKCINHFPDSPQEIPKDRSIFLAKMILSECIEGLAAWNETFVREPTKEIFIKGSTTELDYPAMLFERLNQRDDSSDTRLFFRNIFVECTENTYSNALFDEVFNEVHNANLNKGKYDPVEGRYVFEFKVIGGVRKVIKPAGWIAPDVEAAIQRVNKA